MGELPQLAGVLPELRNTFEMSSLQVRLPAGLLGAWNQTFQTQITEADTANLELPVYRSRPTAQLAAVLDATAELWVSFRFRDF